MIGREGEPALGILTGIDQFQFVRTGQDDGPVRLPVLLGTEGDPVDAGRKGMGAVGFDMDGITGLVESIYECVVQLEGRFAAGYDDAPAAVAERLDR